MPAPPAAKLRPALQGYQRATSHIAFAELAATSNFTFLRGASHPEELVEQAAHLGYRAIAITDTNSLAGIVRAYRAADEAGIQIIVGARLKLAVSDDIQQHDPIEILVYPTHLTAYGHLCQLLTCGKRRAPKGECHLVLHDLLQYHAGLLAIVVSPAIIDQRFIDILRGLKQTFDDDRLALAASIGYHQHDRDRLDRIAALSEHTRVPIVATNDVLYHEPGRQALQDILTCIRQGCTIEQAGFLLEPNAERYLKPPEEMARLFAAYPDAIKRTVQIAERCRGFTLDQIKYQYPNEVVSAGCTAMQHLIDLTRAGSVWRYPQGVPEKVQRHLAHELALIEQLDYPHYFLTVYDIITFARSRGILCQGRGAAANSAVCYCLGITAVDPDNIDVLFERFVSKERDEPPDIDIDFEHERREEVIQYLYEKYGRDRAALTAEVISYRARSAVRDVGKALGFSLDAVDRLAKHLDSWGHEALEPKHLKPLGFSPDKPVVQRLVQLTRQLMGFPRHLSQHVGGFILTDKPLCQLVPIENAAMRDRTVIEWDKDDIDTLGMMKVDVLGLGMLSCIRRCFDLIEHHHSRTLTLANVPQQAPTEDPRVYDMICRADTVGVFQIESRAQMSMLPRLKPRCFYDLVIEVAIVRPGPIQGDMVHPYLRRRHGEQPVTYPDDTARQVLAKTLGVPLFQEQAMNLAIRCAGFTPGEAEQLRRTIQAWRSRDGKILEFGRRIIQGMRDRGYPETFAHRCFQQIKGFGEYGFPESHAASFALLVYVSAWLKYHYPAAFTCALINSQPMGFYAPAQLVRDAKAHGVTVLPVDIHHSRWDCTLEPHRDTLALRLGMRMAKGIHRDDAEKLIDTIQTRGPFHRIQTLWRTSGAAVKTLRCLAHADAFRAMHIDRQQALWQIMKLRDAPAPLFESGSVSAQTPDAADPLPAIDDLTKVTHDYASLGLSLKQHPMHFLRARLNRAHAACASNIQDAARYPHNSLVAVAGVVTIRQRPGTAHGIIFITLEDETGHLNLIVRPRVYQRCRAAVRTAKLIFARGRVERQGEIIHINVRSVQDITSALENLTARSRDFH